MGKQKKSRMGRPPFPKGEAKSVQLVFRVRPVLYRKLRAAARRQGKPLAAWIRETLDRCVGGGE